jgi:hypothetical protein
MTPDQWEMLCRVVAGFLAAATLGCGLSGAIAGRKDEQPKRLENSL